MTKEELIKIIEELDGVMIGFSGCGCCWDEEEIDKGRKEFIDVLWNRIERVMRFNKPYEGV